MGLPELTDDRESVRLGDVHIEQDGRWPKASGQIKPLAASARFENVESLLFQAKSEQAAYLGLGHNHQNQPVGADADRRDWGGLG
jgi:hypothetical protein